MSTVQRKRQGSNRQSREEQLAPKSGMGNHSVLSLCHGQASLEHMPPLSQNGTPKSQSSTLLRQQNETDQSYKNKKKTLQPVLRVLSKQLNSSNYGVAKSLEKISTVAPMSRNHGSQHNSVNLPRAGSHEGRGSQPQQKQKIRAFKRDPKLVLQKHSGDAKPPISKDSISSSNFISKNSCENDIDTIVSAGPKIGVIRQNTNRQSSKRESGQGQESKKSSRNFEEIKQTNDQKQSLNSSQEIKQKMIYSPNKVALLPSHIIKANGPSTLQNKGLKHQNFMPAQQNNISGILSASFEKLNMPGSNNVTMQSASSNMIMKHQQSQGALSSQQSSKAGTMRGAAQQQIILQQQRTNMMQNYLMNGVSTPQNQPTRPQSKQQNKTQLNFKVKKSTKIASAQSKSFVTPSRITTKKPKQEQPKVQQFMRNSFMVKQVHTCGSSSVSPRSSSVKLVPAMSRNVTSTIVNTHATGDHSPIRSNSSKVLPHQPITQSFHQIALKKPTNLNILPKAGFSKTPKMTQQQKQMIDKKTYEDLMSYLVKAECNRLKQQDTSTKPVVIKGSMSHSNLHTINSSNKNKIASRSPDGRLIQQPQSNSAQGTPGKISNKIPTGQSSSIAFQSQQPFQRHPQINMSQTGSIPVNAASKSKVAVSSFLPPQSSITTISQNSQSRDASLTSHNTKKPNVLTAGKISLKQMQVYNPVLKPKQQGRQHLIIKGSKQGPQPVPRNPVFNVMIKGPAIQNLPEMAPQQARKVSTKKGGAIPTKVIKARSLIRGAPGQLNNKVIMNVLKKQIQNTAANVPQDILKNNFMAENIKTTQQTDPLGGAKSHRQSQRYFSRPSEEVKDNAGKLNLKQTSARPKSGSRSSKKSKRSGRHSSKKGNSNAKAKNSSVIDMLSLNEGSAEGTILSGVNLIDSVEFEKAAERNDNEEMVGGNFNTFGEPAKKVNQLIEQKIYTSEPLIERIEKQIEQELAAAGQGTAKALPQVFDFDCYTATATAEKTVKAPQNSLIETKPVIDYSEDEIIMQTISSQGRVIKAQQVPRNTIKGEEMKDFHYSGSFGIPESSITSPYREAVALDRDLVAIEAEQLYEAQGGPTHSNTLDGTGYADASVLKASQVDEYSGQVPEQRHHTLQHETPESNAKGQFQLANMSFSQENNASERGSYHSQKGNAQKAAKNPHNTLAVNDSFLAGDMLQSYHAYESLVEDTAKGDRRNTVLDQEAVVTEKIYTDSAYRKELLLRVLPKFEPFSEQFDQLHTDFVTSADQEVEGRKQAPVSQVAVSTGAAHLLRRINFSLGRQSSPVVPQEKKTNEDELADDSINDGLETNTVVENECDDEEFRCSMYSGGQVEDNCMNKDELLSPTSDRQMKSFETPSRRSPQNSTRIDHKTPSNVTSAHYTSQATNQHLYSVAQDEQTLLRLQSSEPESHRKQGGAFAMYGSPRTAARAAAVYEDGANGGAQADGINSVRVDDGKGELILPQFGLGEGVGEQEAGSDSQSFQSLLAEDIEAIELGVGGPGPVTSFYGPEKPQYEEMVSIMQADPALLDDMMDENTINQIDTPYDNTYGDETPEGTQQIGDHLESHDDQDTGGGNKALSPLSIQQFKRKQVAVDQSQFAEKLNKQYADAIQQRKLTKLLNRPRKNSC